MPATANWLTLAAKPSVEWKILLELQGRYRLRGWTANGTGAYYLSFSLYTHPATLRADLGIYRGLDAVWEGTTALTLRASIIAVESNAGSYFYDTTTSRIYIRTTGVVHPDTLSIVQAVFTLRLSTHSVGFSGLPPFDAMLTGDRLPALRVQQADTLLGVNIFPSGDFDAQNADAFWDSLVEEPWLWKNNTAQFRVGGDDLAYADYLAIDQMQIVEPPTAGVASAVFQMRSLSKALNTSFPQNSYTDYFGPSLRPNAPDIGSALMPMWWGQVYDLPLQFFGDGHFGLNSYLAIDPTILGFGANRVQVQAIRAYDLDGTLVGTLTPVTDYGQVDNWGIEIEPVTGTQPWDPALYTFRADMLLVNGSTIPILYSFGTIALSILEFCGVPTAMIDTAAFAQADLDAPAVLGLSVLGGGPGPETLQTGTELLNQLELSVIGSVHQSSDYGFTCLVYDPAIGDVDDLTVLDETNRLSLDPVAGSNKELFTEVKVKYAQRVGAGQWSETSASSDEADSEQQRNNGLDVDTCLTDLVDARLLASRLRWIASLALQAYNIDGPPLLMSAAPWQKYRIQGSRGPGADGTLDTVMEVTALNKKLNGPLVTATLSNMNGLGASVKGLAARGTPNYSAATADQKLRYIFLVSRTNKMAQDSDPKSYRQHRIW